MRESDLNNRTPSQIDQRPLHAYRISEKDHAELEVEVRQKLIRNQFHFAAKSFVLWAAERYRKEYDGGALSWDFLTEPLGISLEQDKLRDLTREGLRQLGRPLKRREGGTQYLRTIAAEGGIPVKLLSSSSGYSAALIGLVSDISRLGLGCPREVAISFAGRRSLRLPKGYQTLEFRELFVDFAFDIMELRAGAPEGLLSHEVETWLDQFKADWRDGLSLRLDGDAARSLLSGAVSATHRTGLATDILARTLYLEPDGIWSSWIEFYDTAEISPKLLARISRDRHRLRLIPVGSLENAIPDLMFSLECETAGQTWHARRISAERTARVRYPLDKAADLMALADGQFLDRVRLAGGESLDFTTGPSFWKLAEMGEDGPQALTFVGNTSLRTQDPFIWMLTPKSLQPDFIGDIDGLCVGETEGANLWRLSGKGRVCVSKGEAQIRTRAEDDKHEEILAIGPFDYRIRDNQGAPVQNGLPDILHRRTGRGYQKLTAKNLWYRVLPAKTWSHGVPDAATLGRVEFAAKENNGIGARILTNIIPKELNIAEFDTRKPGIKCLQLSGLPTGWSVKIADKDMVTSNSEGFATIELDAKSTRGQIPLILAGPKGSTLLSWSLDLPQELGSFQDSDGNILLREQYISMQDLRNWRITPADQNKTYLLIELHSDLSGSKNPVISKQIIVEQSLSAFRSIFQEMLNIGGNSAKIRLTVVTGGMETARLILHHTLGSTELHGNIVAVVKNQELTVDPKLEITAVDMIEPDFTTKADPTNLTKLGDGKWLLLPRLNGKPIHPPPPYIQPKPKDRYGINSNIPDERITYEEEINTLTKLVNELIKNDFSPRFLDQVLALEKNHETAIKILMHVRNTDLSDILSLELHGGPRWMFINPIQWGNAFEKERLRLCAQFEKIPSLVDQAEKIAREAISKHVSNILRLRPEIIGHILIGLQKVDSQSFIVVKDCLGDLPSGINNPEETLLSCANDVARQNAQDSPRLYDLNVKAHPKGFDRFSADLLGLINAPLFVSEIAHDIRPYSTMTIQQKVELLQAIQTNTGVFERALPAAIAWNTN